MSVLSVLAVTLAPLGILSHVVTRRVPGSNENEVQVRYFRRGDCIMVLLSRKDLRLNAEKALSLA